MKELCMMPCHSCYVYGISRSKEVGMGRGFKVIIWGASHKGKRPIFMGGVEPSRPHVSSQVFGLIYLFSIIDGFEWFWMGNLCKNTQLMVKFCRALFLVLPFFYYASMAFLIIFVICNIAIYADVTTLYSRCDQASNL